jgi:cobalt-precorrin-7 (C5)-methyltransferase
MTESKIWVIGCGPGAMKHLSPEAVRTASEMDVLVGTKRLHELFADLTVPFEACPARSVDALILIEALSKQHECVGVLVTGDPCLYSLGTAVVRHFGRERCRVIPGLSSVQLAFARLGIDWSSARIISAHGRLPDECADTLRQHNAIAVLCGTQEAMGWSAMLVDDLKRTHKAWLCMDMGLPEEEVRAVTRIDLERLPSRSRSIVVLENSKKAGV